MIVFEDNELEIAMVTYDRRDFVREWLRLCYDDIVKRNISFSIYDSSPNTETEELINEYNNKEHKRIKYVKVPSEIAIGNKPMLPILESDSKYLWVSGDSRYHDFAELDEKVFPLIKDGMDCIAFYQGNKAEQFKKVKVYTDKSMLLKDAFVSLTCIGCVLCRLAIFDGLKSDATWMEECDMKYRANGEFTWLGYFLEVFAQNGSTAAVVKIEIKQIFPNRKKPTWLPRFYEGWVEKLIDLADKLPEIYTIKQKIPRNTWNEIKLYSHTYCSRARMNDGLNPEIFEKYMANGMLERVADKKKIRRIKYYAYAPMWQIRIIAVAVQANSRLYNLKRRLTRSGV